MERGLCSGLKGHSGPSMAGPGHFLRVARRTGKKITLDFGKIHSHTGSYGLSGWNCFNCSITVYFGTSQTVVIIRRMANIFQADLG